MSWNFRVIRKKHEVYNVYTNTEANEVMFEYYIHKVHYSDRGMLEYATDRPSTPYGESIQELYEELEMFKAALDKPVLEWQGNKIVEVED